MCIAVAAAVAGCASSSSSGSSSAVLATGNTLTIYLSVPENIAADPNLQDVVYAEQLAFMQNRSKVTGYKLALGTVRSPTVTDNARIAIQNAAAIAYFGELQPGTSVQTVGITEAQDLLQISPTDTATMTDDAFEALSSYGRNFARVVGDVPSEGKAVAAEMQALKVTSVYAADDGSGYGRSTAGAVRAAAKAAGLTVATNESGAGAIFYGTTSPAAASKFFDAAASSDPSAKLFGPSSLYTPQLTQALSSSVTNLYVAVPGALSSTLPADTSFRKTFTTDYGHAPSLQAYLGYEAMSSLLTVLKSAGAKADNRSTVIKDYKKLKFPGGFVIARLQGGKLVPWRTAPTD